MVSRREPGAVSGAREGKARKACLQPQGEASAARTRRESAMHASVPAAERMPIIQ